ncbi:MAG: helix-turn-helix transcriptional regulator [Paracoccaceae bacterium]
MSIIVVSPNAMFRDMLSATCEADGFDVRLVCASLDGIPASDEDDILLMHAAEVSAECVAEIQLFRQRHPEGHIILLAPMGAEPPAELRDLVNVIFSDNHSAKALVGVLTMIGEGFRVSPAGEEPARPKSLPEVAKLHQEKLHAPDAATGALSARETTILARLRDARTNKDIANELGICEGTVKVHLRACYRKIGVRNRTQAAILATQHLS